MISIIFDTVRILLFLTFLSFLCKQLGLLNEKIGSALSQLVLNFTLPMLLLTAFNFDMKTEVLSQGITVGVFSGFAIILTKILFEVLKKFQITANKNYRELLFLTLFGNTVFVGFPIIATVFGEVGLFYAIIYNLVHLVIMWTYGLRIMSSTKTKMISASFLKEPCIIAMIASVMMACLNLKLPNILADTFKMAGSMTYPLSFIIIGLSINFKGFTWKTLNKYLIVIGLRMITVPFLLAIIVRLMGMEMIIAGVVAIMSGTPSAILATIFAEKYNGCTKCTSEGVVITTIMGTLTIPVILALVSVLY